MEGGSGAKRGTEVEQSYRSVNRHKRID